MGNSTYTTQMLFFALIIFIIALHFGKKMHIKSLPGEPNWINFSNIIFSLVITAWVIYWVIHFNDLISPGSNISRGSPVLYLVGLVFALPYFMWQGLFEAIKLISKKIYGNSIEPMTNGLPIVDENIVANYCPICGEKLVDYRCDSCYTSLENIYSIKNNFCIKCGTERQDTELNCRKCGLRFNI